MFYSISVFPLRNFAFSIAFPLQEQCHLCFVLHGYVDRDLSGSGDRVGMVIAVGLTLRRCGGLPGR